MSNWLFIRGSFDENNKYNAKHDLDVWVQIFAKLVGENKGTIYYKSKKEDLISYNKNIDILVSPPETLKEKYLKRFDYVFCRGAFDYYLPILKKCKNAYKIRYAAGKRLMPEKNIHYDLVLVDSAEQKKKVLKKFPNLNVKVFFKPAANHFKPIDIEKKYDVGFVAAIPEDARKRVVWVYKTVPKHLKVLQLGHTPKKLKVPANVKIKHVKSDKMPRLLNQCRLIIAPYTSDDSGPRIVTEALACDVPVLALDSLRIMWKISPHFLIKSTKERFWEVAKELVELLKERENEKRGLLLWCNPKSEFLFYKTEIYNMRTAVSHLKRLIDG